MVTSFLYFSISRF